MELVVNGERHVHRGTGALPDVLREIDAPPERVAVLVNGEVVARADRAATDVKDGDRLDVFALCGGG